MLDNLMVNGVLLCYNKPFSSFSSVFITIIRVLPPCMSFNMLAELLIMMKIILIILALTLILIIIRKSKLFSFECVTSSVFIVSKRIWWMAAAPINTIVACVCVSVSCKDLNLGA